MTTYRSLQMLMTTNPPESQRKPGYHLMSYQWIEADENNYRGELPITLGQNTPFTFWLHDYTKTLQSPTLRVAFEPLPGAQGHSPFSPQETAGLRSGTESSEMTGTDAYNIFKFGPFTLVNVGVEFEFSLQIDDDSNPPDRWYVDPQMIVEGEG